MPFCLFSPSLSSDPFLETENEMSGRPRRAAAAAAPKYVENSSDDEADSSSEEKPKKAAKTAAKKKRAAPATDKKADASSSAASSEDEAATAVPAKRAKTKENEPTDSNPTEKAAAAVEALNLAELKAALGAPGVDATKVLEEACKSVNGRKKPTQWLELIKAIVEAGAKVETRPFVGDVICCADAPEIVKYLISKGAVDHPVMESPDERAWYFAAFWDRPLSGQVLLDEKWADLSPGSLDVEVRFSQLSPDLSPDIFLLFLFVGCSQSRHLVGQYEILEVRPGQEGLCQLPVRLFVHQSFLSCQLTVFVILASRSSTPETRH